MWDNHGKWQGFRILVYFAFLACSLLLINANSLTFVLKNQPVVGVAKYLLTAHNLGVNWIGRVPLAFLVGTAAQIVADIVFDTIICNVLGLRVFRTFDKFWLNNHNSGTVCLVVQMDKFDAKTTSQLILDRLVKYCPGLCVGVYPLMGKHYFFQFPEAEVRKEWHSKLTTVRHDIHTHEQMLDLVKECMMERLELTKLPNVRIHFIPDYKDGKGILVFQADHIAIDGISMYGSLVCATDEMNFDSLPKVKPPHWLTILIARIFTPYFTVKSYLRNTSIKKM